MNSTPTFARMERPGGGGGGAAERAFQSVAPPPPQETLRGGGRGRDRDRDRDRRDRTRRRRPETAGRSAASTRVQMQRARGVVGHARRPRRARLLPRRRAAAVDRGQLGPPDDDRDRRRGYRVRRRVRLGGLGDAAAHRPLRRKGASNVSFFTRPSVPTDV